MKPKKKIIIVGTAYPYKGGLASFNERIANELVQDNDVEIITFTLQYPNFLFPGKTQYSDEKPAVQTPVKRMINAVNPLSWIKTGNYIKSQKPDLVIIKYWLPFMGPAFGSILRLAKKSNNTKVICILDNVIPHEKRIGDVAFTKYFLKPVDAFVAMSKEVLNDLKTFTTLKPAIFSPHPVYDNYGDKTSRDEALGFLKLDRNKQYILFFGYIRKYKGLDILLQAMKDERIKTSNIELIIAGEYYGNAAYYQEMIKQLGVEDKIHTFTEFIPNSEVKYYFSAADAVVQPYKSATQSGISQIAYHYDTPMIVTNVGGLPEIVPHDKVGLVVDPSPEQIADAIIAIYQDSQLSKYKAGVAIEKQKYSWETFCSKIMQLYQNIPT